MKRYIRQDLRGPQAQEQLSPWSSGELPSWYVDVSPAWKVSKAHTAGILRRLPQVGTISYQLHFQPLCLLWRMGVCV